KAGSHRFSEILHAAKFLRGQNSASGRVIPATLSEGMTRFPQNDPTRPVRVPHGREKASHPSRCKLPPQPQRTAHGCLAGCAQDSASDLTDSPPRIASISAGSFSVTLNKFRR